MIPDDIVIEIVKHCSQTDIWCWRLVCKDWYRLLRDNFKGSLLSNRDYEKAMYQGSILDLMATQHIIQGHDWYFMLNYAVLYDKLEIANFIINKIKPFETESGLTEIKAVIGVAIYNNHFHIANWLIFFNEELLEVAFNSAIRLSKYNYARYLMRNGAFNWRLNFTIACYYNNLKMVKFIKEHLGVDKKTYDLGYTNALKNNSIDVIKYLLKISK